MPATFWHKAMFGSSVPPDVCRRAHALCCLGFFAYSDVQHFVLSYIFTFLVPCCNVRYDLHIKAMFSTSLLPVVCKRSYLLFVCVCFRIVLSNTS